MKSLLVILMVIGSQVVRAEEIIGVKFSKLHGMAVVAMVKEQRSLGIKTSPKDIVEMELTFVRTNEIEVAAIAPGHDEEDGIPNYCSVTLARANDYSDYAVKDVHCSPWD